MDDVEKIAEAILYEGYALFPYRADALKNRKRFNFGIVAPRDWAEKRSHETFFQRTECLVSSAEKAFEMTLKTRFLQIENRADKWQAALKREVEVSFIADEISGEKVFDFTFEGDQDFCALAGRISISLVRIGDDLYKSQTVLENLTAARSTDFDEIQARSFLSAHTIFSVRGGRFISLLEPPDGLESTAQECQNSGVFPVLVGDERERNRLLSSPIILYDFPRVAAKSFADFFDGTEIDELMLLSILALTDEEKRAIKNGDEKTRRMIEKIESASPSELLRLHAEMTNG